MTADGDIVVRTPDTSLRPIALQAPVDYADANLLRRSIRGPVRAGWIVIGLFVLTFGIWGTLQPIAGGAVASGFFSPDSSKKQVQHLEGGIVAELRVRDGDHVAAGQTLVVLEDEREKAMHDALQQQRWSLLARQSRLEAELAGSEQVDWPAELRSNDPQIRAIVEVQQQVFDTGRATYIAKKNVLHQKSQQLTEQIKGLQAEEESASHQLDIIQEEIHDKQTLLKKKLVPKPEVLRLKRTSTEILGQRGEYRARIAGSVQQIAETILQSLVADTERADKAATEADKVRSELTQVIEKLRASEAVLKREAVLAPVNGTIINMKFRTIGGVVQRGETILEIVPSDDTLIIEAHVTPVDARSVHPGLSARVRLPAYSSRTTPEIPGTVKSISADRLVDDHTQKPYYLTRVAIDRTQLQRLAPHVELMAGMPADVLIVTDHRTIAEYLFRPLLDAFRRSLREP